MEAAWRTLALHSLEISPAGVRSQLNGSGPVHCAIRLLEEWNPGHNVLKKNIVCSVRTATGNSHQIHQVLIRNLPHLFWAAKFNEA